MVYAEFLQQKLIVFIRDLQAFDGLWREHVKLCQELEPVIELFYMPEVHNLLVPLLTNFLRTGNKTLRKEVCTLLAKILKY